jgi:hypothetical protein
MVNNREYFTITEHYLGCTRRWVFTMNTVNNDYQLSHNDIANDFPNKKLSHYKRFRHPDALKAIEKVLFN